MTRNTTVSFWMDDAVRHGLVPPAAPALEGAARADVLVIGGGFAGLSCAIELARAGRRVTLVEAHRVGFGASGRNAGMLVPLCAPAWMVPGALARSEADFALGEARRRYQELARALVPLDGGPRPATMYFCAPTRLAAQGLDWMRGALASLEIDATLHPGSRARELVGEICLAGLAVPAYAIHPARLVLALREVAIGAGVELFEHTRVTRLEPGAPVEAWTEAGARIEAEWAVLACGAWSPALRARAPGKVTQTWMLASTTLPDESVARLGGPALVASLKPGFMYRRTFDSRLLLGGLDDEVRRPLAAGVVTDDVIPRLRALLSASVPEMRDIEVTAVWGGPILATPHELPLIRTVSDSDRILVVEGLSGSGVLWGLLAGRLARGLVDHALEAEDDRRLREALAATHFPALGALSLGARLALRAWTAHAPSAMRH